MRGRESVTRVCLGSVASYKCMSGGIEFKIGLGGGYLVFVGSFRCDFIIVVFTGGWGSVSTGG